MVADNVVWAGKTLQKHNLSESMMNKQRGNADEVLIWILLALAVLAGLWVYVQIKAFAAWIDVDIDTATSIIGRSVVLIISLGAALWFGVFPRIWTYIPAGAFVCSIPLLDYRAKNFVVGVAMNADPAWFGTWWGQLGIVAVLFGLGYLVSKWWDS